MCIRDSTGALDSKTSVEIMSVLQGLNWEKGITVVMVTHEEEIALHCSRIIRVKDGRIVDDKMVKKPIDASQELRSFPTEEAEVL